MREYAVSVICTAALITLGTAICHRENSRVMKWAFSLILTGAVLLPLIPIMSELAGADYGIEDLPSINYGEEYKRTAEAALELGIERALADKFDIDEVNVKADISGFEFEQMSFKAVNIVLSGKAVFINISAVKNYLEKNFEGCNVKIKLE